MHDIIKAASQGAHIPPSVMHSAQDAIAAIYYLLQQHGAVMAQAGVNGHNAICAAARAMITSLKVCWTPLHTLTRIVHNTLHLNTCTCMYNIV